MGMFTTGLSAYNENSFYNAEADLYDGDFTNEAAMGENYDINFTEYALYAVAENTQFWNNTMKAIGIAELSYFEATGQEIVYEAVDFSSIGEKLKNIFKKIIAKVKHLFHMFMARMSKIFTDNRGFVDKYRKEFTRKWGDVSSSATIKGYKFTISDSNVRDTGGSTLYDLTKDSFKTKLGTDNNQLLKAVVNGQIGDVANAYFNSDDDSDAAKTFFKQKEFDGNSNKKTIDVKTATGSTKDYSAFDALIKKLSDKNEEIQDSIRGIAAKWVGTYANPVYADDKALDEKEFQEKLFESFRNGESSKEDLEITKIFNVAEILTAVADFSKLKKAITQATGRLNSACNAEVNSIEKGIKNATTYIKNNKDESTLGTKWIAVRSKISSYTQFLANQMTKGLGILMTALKDRTSQYKSIMIKVIGGGKKITEESYDYGDSGYDYVSEGRSIFDSVVIK